MDENSMSGVLQRLEVAAATGNRLSIDEAIDTLGHRSHGPFIFMPALLELTPIGGVPGVPTLLSLTILIFAFQVVIGRNDLWLPERLEQVSAPKEKVQPALTKLRPIAARVDRWFPGRLPGMTRPFVQRVAAAMAMVLCFTVPPLEVVPFASSFPMAAIAMFGLSMTLKDGLLMTLGFIFAFGFLFLGAAGLAAAGAV